MLEGSEGCATDIDHSKESSKKTLFLLLLISLTTIAFYARAVDNYWIKDDLAIGNFFVDGQMSWDTLSQELWPSYMMSEHYWRPIPLLPGFLEYKAWGLNPAGYHIDNILMHALTACLLFLLTRRLTHDRHAFLSFLVALIFAINPINAEPVVWVMQRMVLLCLLFSLAGILCWLNAAERRSNIWRIFGLIFLACALLSKEVALTLPGIYFLIDVLYSKGVNRRIRAGFLRAIPCASMLLCYFVCRHIMWGQVVNTYAGLDPFEYARVNSVFENFGQTLLHGFVPVNIGIFGDQWTRVLRIAMLAVFGIAGLRALILIRTNAIWRRVASLSIGLIVLGLLPILPICWVDERLFNARFFYQPALGFVLLVVPSLLLPFHMEKGAGKVTRWIGRGASLLLVIAMGISLAGGLTAFDHGSQQVRGLQQSILNYEASLPKGENETLTIVALYTPTQYEGVPTLEYSLSLALKPPLAPRKVSCVPLLSRDFLTPKKWADELEAGMKERNIQFKNLRWVKCSSDPLGVRPFFGGQEPALGAHPAQPLSPPNHSFLRNTDNEPAFRFKAAGPAAYFKIRFAVEKIDYAWGPKLVVGKNCQEEPDGSFVFKPSFQDPSQPGLPDLWKKMVQKPLRHPLGLTWRVASYDKEDQLIGVSTDFRLVIFNALGKANNS